MTTAKKNRRNPTKIGFLENWNAEKNVFFNKGPLARSQTLVRNCIAIYSHALFLSRQRKNKGMGAEKRGILLFRFST
jgi:hypothetical protein